MTVNKQGEQPACLGVRSLTVASRCGNLPWNLSKMDVSTFFTRLLQSTPKEPEKVRAPDSEYRSYDETWKAVQVRQDLAPKA